MKTAQQALGLWGLEAAQTQLLPTSQIPKYRAFQRGQSYLLRLHPPSQDPRQLEAELVWLEYLYTQGLHLPKPLRTHKGDWIGQTAEGWACVLGWLEGQPADPPSPAQAARVGALLAQLHQTQPPALLPRPHYHALYFEQLWAGLAALRWMHSNDLEAFQAFIHHTQGLWRTQPCLIHADAQPANWIQGTGLGLIDFERCGYGPAAYDLAVALGFLATPTQDAFLQGYKGVQALPQGFELERPRWLMLAYLDNLAFLAPRPAERRFVEDEMLPFMRRAMADLP